MHRGASAYFFDSPGENVTRPLTVGSESIPTFGSGTLGYVSVVAAEAQAFQGHSGFLLAQVEVAQRDPATKRAPVSARLTPDIGELALEAEDGVLLRRSQPALFSALARRPRSGGRAERDSSTNESAVYIPIPANCVGTECEDGIFPEYTFSSSRPFIGNFVRPNLALADPHSVLLGPNEEPIPDPQSGLFCAFNAGTTIVTISAGGLSSSLPVTVQAGSVRRPCGTTRLPAQPSPAAHVPVSPPPAPAASPAPATAPPPVPPPPLASPLAPPVRPVAHETPPFLSQPIAPFLVPVLVPPPLPAPANPTPPSGTSAVSVEAVQKEEEEEEATESVSNRALAYRASESEPSPAYLLGIVLLAAFAGAAGARRRPRRGRRELRVAPATINGMRAQRRLSKRGRPLP